MFYQNLIDEFTAMSKYTIRDKLTGVYFHCKKH
jgi:hypothetical protein